MNPHDPKTPTPPIRHILVTGRLSLAGLAELAERVRAGEDETAVRAELLLREGKAVAA
jgi:hypothetical protein